VKRAALRLAAVVAVAAVASACSPIFINKAPPEPEPLRWPRCTEHRLYPLIDATVTATAAVGTLALLASDDDFAALGAIFLVPMLLGFGGSAIYGLSETADCARARAAYEAAALQGR
jgi:hypothetical protein